jgi:hypothetical protein
MNHNFAGNSNNTNFSIPNQQTNLNSGSNGNLGGMNNYSNNSSGFGFYFKKVFNNPSSIFGGE